MAPGLQKSYFSKHKSSSFGVHLLNKPERINNNYYYNICIVHICIVSNKNNFSCFMEYLCMFVREWKLPDCNHNQGNSKLHIRHADSNAKNYYIHFSKTDIDRRWSLRKSKTQSHDITFKKVNIFGQRPWHCRCSVESSVDNGQRSCWNDTEWENQYDDVDWIAEFPSSSSALKKVCWREAQKCRGWCWCTSICLWLAEELKNKHHKYTQHNMKKPATNCPSRDTISCTSSAFPRCMRNHQAAILQLSCWHLDADKMGHMSIEMQN